MILNKYISINRSLRSVHQTIRDIMDTIYHEGDGFGTATLSGTLNRQLSDLEMLLPIDLDLSIFEEFTQELLKSDNHSAYWSVATHTLPRLEDQIDDYFSLQPISNIDHTIIDLLHGSIISSSYHHFKSGNYRDAVLNAIIAVYDLIRLRTKIDKDGSELLGHVFSLTNPLLIVTELDSESGKSDQKGFMQLLNGLYQGVRNPKAHTLTIKPTKNVAAQYLVFTSLLCRRVDESKLARLE